MGRGLTRDEWFAEILHRRRCDRHRHRFPADRRVRRWARRQVVLRDGEYCAHCGATEELVLDHVTPWSQGGSSHPGNLELLCRTCNDIKADT